MVTQEHLDVQCAYEEALDYLYSFINLERKTLERYHASKMDPDRPLQLLDTLGAPQKQYAAMHIAGTKGKGSVAAMSAAALQASGLRVGLYTSPHLRDFRERIRVLTPDDKDGKISKQEFITALNEIKEIEPSFPGITWFEIVTAVAFSHFASRQVDVAVVEVGLGGRLDATNVLTPLVSIITSLSLDHTNLLGDTLAEIAAEKGGIIKPEVPVVIAPQSPQALARLREIAAKEQSPLEIVGHDWQYSGVNHLLSVTLSPHEGYVAVGTTFEVGLAGSHQLENGMLAIAALRPFQERYAGVTLETIKQGLAAVQWDGRLQMVLDLPGWPSFLVDSAHNLYSAIKLSSALQTDYDYDRLWLIFGAPMDKAISLMMQELFPLAHQVIVAAADHPRAASPQALQAQANELGFEVQTAGSPEEALFLAFDQVAEDDLICATGSIIFIGDLLNHWDRLQSQILLPRG
jgi:dihydrofolate synthase/folylpolyglutamate synthase